MLRAYIATAILGGALAAITAATAAPPVEWDGLQRVDSKRFDLVYLQPGATFAPYSKLIVEPAEVAFRKNWRRDYNSSTRDLGGKVSEQDVQEAVSKGVTAASDIFTEAWRGAGYTIVDVPGPDVLKVRTGIVNISVKAPDVRTSARSYSFSDEAGHATLVVELRDSMTNALLARVVDQKVAGDSPVGWRTSVGNREDFRQIVREWAKDSVRGMSELKSMSPAR